MLKKRRKNKEKDLLDEPQFVTKRTSSGRLVKMKISHDYDYTSDQELEASKKKKRVDDVEGIQRKHRKHSDSSSSLSHSEDEEFKSAVVDRQQSKMKRGPYKKRGRPKTIKALTESINKAKFNRVLEEEEEDDDLFKHTFDDDEIDDEDDNSDDSDLTKLNLTKLNNSTKFFRRLTSLHEPSSNQNTNETKTNEQLTFEQYVKKLTGNLNPSKNQTSRLSFKVTPAPSLSQTSNKPLTIPVINPAIKAALNKLNTSEIKPAVLNTTNQAISQLNKTIIEPSTNSTNSVVKVITVNGLSNALNTTASSLANKKIVITSPAINNSPNLVKVINISQFANGIKSSVKPQILSPILNRPMVVVNNGLVKANTSLMAVPITSVAQSIRNSTSEVQNSVNKIESDTKTTTPDNQTIPDVK